VYISLIKELAFNHDPDGDSDGASITGRGVKSSFDTFFTSRVKLQY
jgi:hypothetical protein